MIIDRPLTETLTPSTTSAEVPNPHELSHLSFHLDAEFVASYATQKPKWGFDIGGGNTLGELTYVSKYSRLKKDGTKERWFETVERVVSGMFSILKDHAHNGTKIPWDEARAQVMAQTAYDQIFTFKWTPPGRGLWAMGTEYQNRFGSTALQNCAYLSTGNIVEDPTGTFTLLMTLSMFGVGVGFGTEGADLLTINEPTGTSHFVIPDTREGWVESVELLLQSYLTAGAPLMSFDYSEIRPLGTPIKGFGGTASGPAPLVKLHKHLQALLSDRAGQTVTSRDICDIANMIGKAVASGNVRRSAEIAIGEQDDYDFLSLKDFTLDRNQERLGVDGWGHLSNNTVRANVGDDLTNIAQLAQTTGEPGILWMDICRSHGRLADPANHKDINAAGTNPCAEQTLDDRELCTLVETFPTAHADFDEFAATLKMAYLYGKAVTLLPTHIPELNVAMSRNRRIGTSMTGLAMFVEQRSWTELRRWCDEGYAAIVERDKEYSRWLGVRESIKTTSIKPSGTVSLLAGVTPGCHWSPTSGGYLRRMRFRVGDPMLDVLAEAGYPAEPDVRDPDTTVVVTFPTMGPNVRNERQVTIWEKMELAALLQAHWADNQVSATFTFQPDEAEQLPTVLQAFDGRLKSASFLPLGDEAVYEQAPYEKVTESQFAAQREGLSQIDFGVIYNSGTDVEAEAGCTNDTCTI